MNDACQEGPISNDRLRDWRTGKIPSQVKEWERWSLEFLGKLRTRQLLHLPAAKYPTEHEQREALCRWWADRVAAGLIVRETILYTAVAEGEV